MSGLAITDHNSQEGIGEAMEAGRRRGIVVIPGVEVSCREGHVLVYGQGKVQFTRGGKVGDLLASLHGKTGCLAAVAHPFDRFRSGIGWDSAGYPFGAVETVNAHSPLPRGVVLPLARRLGVGELGGSDAHEPGGLGKGYTIVRAAGDISSILAAVSSSGQAGGGFDLWSLVPAWLRRHSGQEV